MVRELDASHSFISINKRSAQVIYENSLPFNHSADMWMNDVSRKCNLNFTGQNPHLLHQNLTLNHFYQSISERFSLF